MKTGRKTKFNVGDRVKVVHHMAGEMDHGRKETGTVRTNLPLPNPFTGVYPGVIYTADDTDGDSVALEGELEKIE